MSTFRWACQKKFSEGLQNLGFISVARHSAGEFSLDFGDNFTMPRKSVTNIESANIFLSIKI